MTHSPKNTRIWVIFGTSFVAFIAMAQYLRPPPAPEQNRTLASCIAESRSFTAQLSDMDRAKIAAPDQSEHLRLTRDALDKIAEEAASDPQFRDLLAQETALSEATRERDGTQDPYAYASHEIDILNDCVDQALR